MGRLLNVEFRTFCRKHFVLRRADVTANAILLDRIDDQLVSKLIATDEELHRLVGCAVSLLQAIVVNLNRDAVLVILGIRLQQRQLNVRDSLKRLFGILPNVEFEIIAFALLSKLGEFAGILGDAFAQNSLHIDKLIP